MTCWEWIVFIVSRIASTTKLCGKFELDITDNVSIHDSFVKIVKEWWVSKWYRVKQLMREFKKIVEEALTEIEK